MFKSSSSSGSVTAVKATGLEVGLGGMSLSLTSSIAVKSSSPSLSSDSPSQPPIVLNEKEAEAATKIQAIFRGHRERQKMEGMSIKNDEKWDDIVARIRFKTTKTDGKEAHELPKARWKRAMFLVGRIQHSHSQMPEEDGKGEELNEEQLVKMMNKDMDTVYWLEMIDPQHRYGANLKFYHTEWVQSSTRQNFFHWLDSGEGKDLSLVECPRSELNREKIVYLSADQRKDYLVKIENGLFQWKKTGENITTDEVHKGKIKKDYIKITDYMENIEEADAHLTPEERKKKEKKNTKGVFVHPLALLQKALRNSPIQQNAWIYVTDLLFNLYVGAKEAGTFQHSSFLSGARVTSAGLIQIEDGKLVSLAPLSGHYKCTTKHFELFMKKLAEKGVDMKKVKVDSSFGLLKTIETLDKWKKQRKEQRKAIREGFQKLFGIQQIELPKD